MVADVNPVARLVCLALTVYWIILLARVVLSWLQLAGMRPPTHGPLRAGYEILFDVTEPVLRPLRRVVPPAGMFDLSIVVAFVIIFVLQSALCRG
jgi:YggT family protein